ncbi:MAG: NUDIX hydrolase [Dysgonomonas sp.]
MSENDDKAWKVLKSEYLFQEPWLTVRREHVELPNGNQIPSYYVLEYPDWVCTIAITKDKQFLLIRQYRHGAGKTSMELSAGVCEKEDSSPMVSAQRELWEETGYGKGEWSLLMKTSANPGTHTNTTYCYLATDVEKISEQHLEPTEDITVCLLSLDELKEILYSDEIIQSMHVVAIWKYLSINNLI